MVKLLELPSEIRNHIWTLGFGHRAVTPEKLSSFTTQECTPCKANSDLPERFIDAIKGLKTCKQIYQEATPIFYSTLTLVLNTYQKIDHMLDIKPALLSQHRNLVLYIHLNDENRLEWAVSALDLTLKSPQLKNLTMHNHMRPPMSYEHLVDGLFFAVPLVGLPSRVDATLKFDYIFEDVMFASPYLGEIKCSDALEEHELVLRDLLVDEQFCIAARARDIETMTGILVNIARRHEQPWFAKLQRRRQRELERMEQQAQDGTQSESG